MPPAGCNAGHRCHECTEGVASCHWRPSPHPGHAAGIWRWRLHFPHAPDSRLAPRCTESVTNCLHLPVPFPPKLRWSYVSAATLTNVHSSAPNPGPASPPYSCLATVKLNINMYSTPAGDEDTIRRCTAKTGSEWNAAASQLAKQLPLAPRPVAWKTSHF